MKTYKKDLVASFGLIKSGMTAAAQNYDEQQMDSYVLPDNGAYFYKSIELGSNAIYFNTTTGVTNFWANVVVMESETAVLSAPDQLPSPVYGHRATKSFHEALPLSGGLSLSGALAIHQPLSRRPRVLFSYNLYNTYATTHHLIVIARFDIVQLTDKELADFYEQLNR